MGEIIEGEWTVVGEPAWALATRRLRRRYSAVANVVIPIMMLGAVFGAVCAWPPALDLLRRL